MFSKFGQRTAILLTIVLGSALGGIGCKNQRDPQIDDNFTKKDASLDGKKQDARDAAVSSDTFKNQCAPDARAKIRNKGEACACDLECQSGFCVQGICCNSACKEGCKSCSIRGAIGECTNIPLAGEPSQPAFCVTEPRNTCGLEGTCDGNGGCRKYSEGTPCNAGHCEGDSVIGALECDGKGNCSVPSPNDCWPRTCNPITSECIDNCTSDQQCAAAQKCDVGDGSCGKQMRGSKCKTDSQCFSGFCTDGVCCNSSCKEPCKSCNREGFRGTCEADDKTKQDPECLKTTDNPCGNTGFCDGSGSCAIADDSAVCKESVCSSATQKTDIRVCDGKGTCKTPQVIDCYPYACVDGTCNTSCQSDKDCAENKACIVQVTNGVTTRSCGPKPLGVPCTTASECGSGFCEDHVCCKTACGGKCQSCNIPGSSGTCMNVPLNSKDPHGICKDTGVASCKTNGQCDGAGGCQNYKPSTPCGPSICKDGVFTPPSECNSSGQCIPSKTVSCGNMTCKDPTKCFDSCTNNDQCMPGNFCVNASCGLKPKGSRCSIGKECMTGFCAQGYCCDKACTEPCKTCALATSLGTCSNVKDGDSDPQEKCANPAKDPCGFTGKCQGGACAYAKKDTNCKEAVCASPTSRTPAYTCDGAGKCESKAPISCAPYVCASSVCKGGCTSNADCVPPNICQNGSCGLKPDGQACTNANQCSSGNCVEGYCCNSTCTGLCKSCAVAGSLGTCSNVVQGGTDPGNRCIASTVESGNFCAFNGQCDGAGACAHRATTEGCRAASCTAAVLTLAANCNGAGACPTVVTTSCGNYQCHSSGTSCLTSCTTAADCTGGLPCTTNPATGQKQCGLTLPNGDACDTDANCTNGHCVEGVCCNVACTNLCESCNLAGTRGQCVPVPLGQDPRNACTATTPTAPSGCANDGTCNGAGACSPWSTATVCRAASCASGTATQEAKCDGAGNCPIATTLSCTPFICGTNACRNECTQNSECSSGYECSGTQCKKVLGQTCAINGDCASNFCTDGVCCGVSSCGTCMACGAGGTCVARANISGTTCDDSNACTVSDVCAANGSCAGVPKNCSDGLACTTDSCTGGVCGHSQNSNTCLIDGVCYASGDVNPGNTCQVCNPSTPNAWSLKLDGATCNDGNACTQTDTCQTGVCSGANPVVCTASDQCHDVGVCNTLSGTCSNPNKINGTSCNDSNLCTQTDTCQGGICLGANPVVCTASDQCHDVGTCNTATGTCSDPSKVDGASCSDGNACTQTDTCQSGTCLGSSPVVCTASDQCHDVGVCNPTSGTCSNPNKVNGSVCNDSNLCTQDDACQNGTCSGTPSVVCTASDQCHDVGTCIPATGICSNPNKTNGTACDDGNACTLTDTCQTGVCSGANSVVCTASDQCHDIGVCNTSTGICSNPNKADGEICNDGNACTGPDTCQAGACISGAVIAPCP